MAVKPFVHRQPMHERIGKAVRREGRGQEAGECDGDLNGGKKAVRRLHEHKQLLRLLVALLRLLRSFVSESEMTAISAAAKNALIRISMTSTRIFGNNGSAGFK